MIITNEILLRWSTISYSFQEKRITHVQIPSQIHLAHLKHIEKYKV